MTLVPTDTRWSIVLPTAWWRVPLTSAPARQSAVKALVQHQFGFSDADPRLKRRVQADLLRSAERAASAGGQLMALMALDVAGGAIDAALTLYLTVSPPPEAQDAEEPSRLDVASAGLRPTAEAAWAIADDGSEMLRAVEVLEHELEATTGPDGAAGPTSRSELRVDYWVAPVDAEPVFWFVFTTASVGLREPMIEVFDAIVQSLDVGER